MLPVRSFVHVIFFLFLFCFVLFWDRLSPCSPDCLGTHYVDQTGFKLTESHLPPSWVLELKHHAWLMHGIFTFMAVTKYPTENWKGRKFFFGSVFQRFWHFLQGKVWWKWAAHAMGGQGAERDAWFHWGPHGQGSAAYVECRSIPLWKLRGKLLISAVLSNPVKLVIKVTDSHITSNPPPAARPARQAHYPLSHLPSHTSLLTFIVFVLSSFFFLIWPS